MFQIYLNRESFIFVSLLREAAKKQKKSSTNGRAIKRGGGKGRAIKEKITFLKLFFLILLPFKNINYFTLDNLSKYGHITLKFVGRYFYLLVTIYPKNWAILVQNCGEKKSCQNPFSAILRLEKKTPMAI